MRLAKDATGEEELNERIIFARASWGDEVMLSILDRWIADITAGIVGLVHTFNPQMVLIGGGVGTQKSLFINPLRERSRKTVMPRFAEGLQIEAATLGNDAGMIGAAKFYMDCCGK